MHLATLIQQLKLAARDPGLKPMTRDALTVAIGEIEKDATFPHPEQRLLGIAVGAFEYASVIEDVPPNEQTQFEAQAKKDMDAIGPWPYHNRRMRHIGYLVTIEHSRSFAKATLHFNLRKYVPNDLPTFTAINQTPKPKPPVPDAQRKAYIKAYDAARRTQNLLRVASGGFSFLAAIIAPLSWLFIVPAIIYSHTRERPKATLGNLLKKLAIGLLLGSVPILSGLLVREIFNRAVWNHQINSPIRQYTYPTQYYDDLSSLNKMTKRSHTYQSLLQKPDFPDKPRKVVVKRGNMVDVYMNKSQAIRWYDTYQHPKHIYHLFSTQHYATSHTASVREHNKIMRRRNK